MPEIILLLHNIRSTHNVGSILRTAEGFGIKKVIFSGYTPYPKIEKDTRLPHIFNKLTDSISKTALGAEKILTMSYENRPPINELKNKGYRIVALEQNSSSVSLKNYKIPGKLALLLGEEVHGVEENLLKTCDDIIEIPMNGKKESFNVSVATGIALYSLTTEV